MSASLKSSGEDWDSHNTVCSSWMVTWQPWSLPWIILLQMIQQTQSQELLSIAMCQPFVFYDINVLIFLPSFPWASASLAIRSSFQPDTFNPSVRSWPSVWPLLPCLLYWNENKTKLMLIHAHNTLLCMILFGQCCQNYLKFCCVKKKNSKEFEWMFQTEISSQWNDLMPEWSGVGVNFTRGSINEIIWFQQE